MKNRCTKVYATVIIAVSIIFVAGIVQASVCPGTNVIEDPVPFHWISQQGYFSGTLEIGQASFTIGGESLTTRAYRQDPNEIPPGEQGGEFSIPGPTMFMTPGNTYVLTFKNTLPYAEPSQEHNVLKDPNISNIHTHGLHVSGETPGDDVTRLINGGQCGDYVYDIQLDHMGGTLWYHAHHHGSTWLQVAGGTFGMLIVDDSGDGIPAGVAGMDERQLAIGYLDPAGVAGNGGDTIISGNFTSKWTVNGYVNGNLCTPIDEWQHWRVLLADPDAKMKTVTIGPECEAVLMARDGVWRTSAPLALENNSIDLTGASRADLAVKCSADSTIAVNNTVVANIYADGVTNKPNVGPYSEGATGTAWSAIRPNYLRDLRGEAVADARTINMGARTVSGDQYDENIPSFDIEIPGVQEWNIKGATNHPFHLHVYHQQMQGDCGSGGSFEDGEYYDTIAGSCLVRFDSNPATETAYEGRTIMHCHILEHEDQGAMTWADNTLLGAIGPPISPNPNHQDIYNCGACSPTGVAESICNGVDDDCDGLIDEDYVPTPTTCGVGECAGNTGQLECQNGAEVDTCDPLAGAVPEVCDDPGLLDEDCDGLANNDDPDCQVPGNCSEIMDRNTCRNTAGCEWIGGKNGMCVDAAGCEPTTTNEVGLCDDGIDNDCDGVIDCADTIDCGDDPVCQQPDCSVYTNKQDCNNEPTDSCRWDKQNGMCIPK